jgi:hypothetical protein
MSKAPPAKIVQDYTWHDNAMAGKRGPVYDGDPQSGWYRSRKLISERGELPKRYELQAVAYWKDTKSGEQRCHVNGKSVDTQRMMELWQYCNASPISEDTYDAFTATGQWPDKNQVAAEDERLSNEAPAEDSLEDIKARIDALLAEAKKLRAKGVAKTQAEADAAADVAVKLGELYHFAEKRRKIEKEPSLQEGKRIDNLWNPVRDSALIYQDLKQEVVDPFIRAENKRLADEAAKAEAERLRIIREAEEKAAEEQRVRDAAHNDAMATAIEEGEPLPDKPERVEVVVPETIAAPVAFVPVRAGTGSKKVTSRDVKTAVINDYVLALSHFKDHADVKEVVQKLADKAAKLDMPIPGCTIVNGSKAV